MGGYFSQEFDSDLRLLHYQKLCVLHLFHTGQQGADVTDAPQRYTQTFPGVQGTAFTLHTFTPVYQGPGVLTDFYQDTLNFKKGGANFCVHSGILDE